MLAAVVGLVCLVVGVLLGRAIAPARALAPIDVAPAPALAAPESPARPWLRKAFRDRAAGVAEVVASAGREHPTAAAFEMMAVEGWSVGVEELREALIRSSGLPAELMDEVCSIALASIEASRSAET